MIQRGTGRIVADPNPGVLDTPDKKLAMSRTILDDMERAQVAFQESFDEAQKYVGRLIEEAMAEIRANRSK